MPKGNLFATVTPTKGKIPIALATGRIAGGWIPTNFADVTVVPGDYEVADTDYIVLVAATAVITLPTAVGRNGQVCNIVRVGTGDVVIAPPDGQQISGDTFLTLTSQWDSVTVVAVDSGGIVSWVRCS